MTLSLVISINNQHYYFLQLQVAVSAPISLFTEMQLAGHGKTRARVCKYMQFSYNLLQYSVNSEIIYFLKYLLVINCSLIYKPSSHKKNRNGPKWSLGNTYINTLIDILNLAVFRDQLVARE